VSATRHYLDSLVPSWLAADPGYRAALGQHILDRMALQDWQPVTRPAFSDVPSDVPPPVGMTLLRATVAVEEFDLDMGDEADEPPAGHWVVYESAPGRVHVAPLDDEAVHEFTEDCVCAPTPRPEATASGTGWVITHHSFDGREQYEPGDAGG
jgi:hypothetical protein